MLLLLREPALVASFSNPKESILVLVSSLSKGHGFQPEEGTLNG